MIGRLWGELRQRGARHTLRLGFRAFFSSPYFCLLSQKLLMILVFGAGMILRWVRLVTLFKRVTGRPKISTFYEGCCGDDATVSFFWNLKNKIINMRYLGHRTNRLPHSTSCSWHAGSENSQINASSLINFSAKIIPQRLTWGCFQAKKRKKRANIIKSLGVKVVLRNLINNAWIDKTVCDRYWFHSICRKRRVKKIVTTNWYWLLVLFHAELKGV